MEALAARANMSVSTFHEHFKRCTDMAPMQYLKRLRLLKAQQMLIGEGLGVAQAAHRVGFRAPRSSAANTSASSNAAQGMNCLTKACRCNHPI